MSSFRRAALWRYAALVLVSFGFVNTGSGGTVPAQAGWTAESGTTRPWTYWWWMASAVDETNITRELVRYREAGLGGVHIIPIYGAKGYESRFIEYLSPRWLEMLRYTVTEARRLGLDVDMTTGSGWCFGGPRVTDQDANATVTVRTNEVRAGQSYSEKFGPGTTVVAFSSEGKSVGLHPSADGSVSWSPESGTWRVYAVSQKPSGQKVKRAGPGGQGHMLNLLYPEAMRHFLGWFDDAFRDYPGPWPRAMYHDSYEYRTDWAPDFFPAFERRRGYRLETQLPALFGNEKTEQTARVKCDYRETVSDVMVEETLPLWASWARGRGLLTRNEAHGSPGNWLDLYAAADIPETEMFYKDRNRLISKFASSAAHVTGKRLASSETGTWLKEHFTETLADMKYLLDDMFLSGVNHVLYHGTCYSPDEAAWPGWLFYASYEMNPRNSVWRDVSALNAYASRCQAVLQSGRPDNDVLLYWPIHDLWHDPSGRVRNLTVHARDWFEQQPIGRAAEQLWSAGYAFDYVSDRQLASVRCVRGKIESSGSSYEVVVVPATRHLPVPTARELMRLAGDGATVIFEGSLPSDVPGWSRFEERRAELAQLFRTIRFKETANGAPAEQGRGVRKGKLGKGRVLTGDLARALVEAEVPREPLFDHGLMCVRRVDGDGYWYFLANRSETNSFEGWLPLARTARSATVMDPLTGKTGLARLRKTRDGKTEALLSLAAGESLLARCSRRSAQPQAPQWNLRKPAGSAHELTGKWVVAFLQGGPELPAGFETARLVSWTELGDTNALRFAGAACYRIRFDAPDPSVKDWQLDLGRVCQSARVRLNGKDLGTVFTPPFRVYSSELKAKDNLLEVEVTNVSANRIRDLDRRGVQWKNFYDANFVNLDYKPFNAADWPLTDSGLLGPVTLVPVVPAGN